MKLLLALVAALLLIAGFLGAGPVPLLYVFGVIVLVAAVLA